jgi:hypothetical protein
MTGRGGDTPALLLGDAALQIAPLRHMAARCSIQPTRMSATAPASIAQ